MLAPVELYVLRDLPGVAEVEQLLKEARASGDRNWKWSEPYLEAERKAKLVSRNLFGSSVEETRQAGGPLMTAALTPRPRMLLERLAEADKRPKGK